MGAVKRMIEGRKELKYVDTALTNQTPYAGTSTIQCISLIAQGDGPSARDGNEVYLHSCHYRFRIIDDLTNTNDSLFRIMIVKRKEATGSNPAITDILTTDEFYDLRSFVNRRDIQVLHDKTFKMKESSNASDRSQVWIEKYMKFKKPILTTYNSTTASITVNETNELFIVLMCQNVQADACIWNGKTRVTFKER